jgi:hypothetical protein
MAVGKTAISCSVLYDMSAILCTEIFPGHAKGSRGRSVKSGRELRCFGPEYRGTE